MKFFQTPQKFDLLIIRPRRHTWIPRNRTFSVLPAPSIPVQAPQQPLHLTCPNTLQATPLPVTTSTSTYPKPKLHIIIVNTFLFKYLHISTSIITSTYTPSILRPDTIRLPQYHSTPHYTHPATIWLPPYYLTTPARILPQTYPRH